MFYSSDCGEEAQNTPLPWWRLWAGYTY